MFYTIYLRNTICSYTTYPTLRGEKSSSHGQRHLLPHLQTLLDLRNLSHPRLDSLLHALRSGLIRRPGHENSLWVLDARCGTSEESGCVLGRCRAALDGDFGEGGLAVEREGFVVLAFSVEGVDLGDGLGEDVGKGGDAACGAGSETGGGLVARSIHRRERLGGKRTLR